VEGPKREFNLEHIIIVYIYARTIPKFISFFTYWYITRSVKETLPLASFSLSWPKQNNHPYPQLPTLNHSQESASWARARQRNQHPLLFLSLSRKDSLTPILQDLSKLQSMLMHGCYSPGFILLEVGNHDRVSILPFLSSISSLTKKPSYFKNYSPSHSHLKFLVHVCLFCRNHEFGGG
jgi:hypothetical protein